MKYNQSWLFTRDVQKIHSDKVKSISIKKSWVINSFINMWSLHFLAEWDRNRWDIIMDYVDNIEYNAKEVRKVLGMYSV